MAENLEKNIETAERLGIPKTEVLAFVKQLAAEEREERLKDREEKLQQK
jgi:hypothetical protein